MDMSAETAIKYDPAGDILAMLLSVQDAIVRVLTEIAPEGGLWTLDRLAETVGYARSAHARHIFDTAVEGLATQDAIVTDGVDVMLP